MQREAEQYADQDKQAKEGIEIRNNADTLAYQSEKQLKELEGKIPDSSVQPIKDAIDKVREALKGSDIEAIRSAYDDLQQKFSAASEEMYKAAAASAGAAGEAGAGAPPPTGGESAKKPDGDVVDAEFEMVDEDKKK